MINNARKQAEERANEFIELLESIMELKNCRRCGTMKHIKKNKDICSTCREEIRRNLKRKN